MSQRPRLSGVNGDAGGGTGAWGDCAEERVRIVAVVGDDTVCKIYDPKVGMSGPRTIIVHS